MLGYKQDTSILNQEHPDSGNYLWFLTLLKMKSQDGYGTQEMTVKAAQFLRAATWPLRVPSQ